MDNRPFLYFLTKGDQLVVCVIRCPKASMFYFTKNEQFISASTTTLTVPLSQWECYYQGKDGRTSSHLSCPKMIPKNVFFLDHDHTHRFSLIFPHWGGSEGSWPHLCPTKTLSLPVTPPRTSEASCSVPRWPCSVPRPVATRPPLWARLCRCSVRGRPARHRGRWSNGWRWWNRWNQRPKSSETLCFFFVFKHIF